MLFFFFCKQKTAYEIRIRDWSSDVCSSDLDFFTDAVPQRVGDQSALLRDVALGEACGGRSGFFPASIAGAFRLNIGLRQTLFDKRFNKEPGSLVLRLFLRPNHLLQSDHAPEAGNQRVSRKRIELFNTDDLRDLVARRVTRLDKVIGHLATAKH